MANLTRITRFGMVNAYLVVRTTASRSSTR